MSDCPICYEWVPSNYPKTTCCGQLIHLDCIRKCRTISDLIFETECPLCRTPIMKYPNTRRSISMVGHLRELVDCCDAIEDSPERAIAIIYVLEFLMINQTILNSALPEIYDTFKIKLEMITEYFDIVALARHHRRVLNQLVIYGSHRF